ncbi:MAG TPA: hypothetical protein VNN72_02010 [Polyangiaceae bacterium]|nr:hypothetical protein [Polyangiaceae bacterium]
MTKPGGAFSIVFWGASALVAVGCTKPDVEIKSLPNGTRQLTCRHTLPQCLSHVDDVCKGASYEILYATDTQKVYGSPSSNEVESRTSQAVVHCLGVHQEPMGEAVAGQSLIAAAAVASASASAKPGAAPAASGAVALTGAPRPASAPPIAEGPAVRTCVPGATQACVGPAACSGGQSCLPDGSGFGACDCGTAKKTSP